MAAPTPLRPSSPSANDLVVQYRVGEFVPWHLEAKIIVASYFASLMGAILTVELLHHKQLGKSFAARLQLLFCAMSMGLIGIWSMHYIGNRSLVLGDGRPNLQLAYSPGFTVLSCILPVIGLSVAFYLAEVRIKNFWVRRLLDIATGVFAGHSVVAMHYTGNQGISNYRIHYKARWIVAASCIGVGDCTIALALFFYFKEHWVSQLWKRLMCASFLAVAVCSMHYTAMLGCMYRLTRLDGSGVERNTAVLVAGILCVFAAIICVSFMVYAGFHRKHLKAKARQVSLACAYFDAEGNILVTNEGVLPTQKIAKRFNPQSFDDDFSTAHPTFHWIWKVTNDWSSVSELIPKMRTYLRRVDDGSLALSRFSSRSSAENGTLYDDGSLDYSLPFRQSFCVAAADLADRLHLGVAQLGTLFDQIISTGVVPEQNGRRRLNSVDAMSIASSGGLGDGSVLFFIRLLTTQDIDYFSASGYRFAPPPRVSAMIAQTLGAPVQLVTEHIKTLRMYAQQVDKAPTVKQGTYLTCFAALGRLTRQFDVVVPRTSQGQLPDTQLYPEQLTAEHLDFLRQYDSKPAGEMKADLELKRLHDHLLEPFARSFVFMLLTALSDLSHQIPESWFKELVFKATPIECEYGRVTRGTIMVLGLTKLLDIHSGNLSNPDRLAFTPLNFFRLRTAFSLDCFDLSNFRSAVHAEFAGHLSKMIEPDMALTTRPRSTWIQSLAGRLRRGRHAYNSDDNVSVHNLVELPRLPPVISAQSPGKIGNSTWGGILATTDTTMSRNEVETSSGVSTDGVITAVVGKGSRKQDAKTYVDLLFEQARVRCTARTVAVPSSR